MEATVRFPSTPELADAGRAFGVVRAVGVASDPATRRGTVELEVSGVGPGAGTDGGTAADVRPLPVGLFAVATIRVEELPDALWIARRHLAWKDGAPTCYVLEREGDGEVARPRTLVLAAEHGEGFLVADGLAPGDLLVTGPLDRVAAGTPCTRAKPPGPEGAAAGDGG
jgi:hypothetical protein